MVCRASGHNFFQDIVTRAICAAETADALSDNQHLRHVVDFSISLIVRLEQELASKDPAPACLVGVNVGYSLTVIMHTKFQTARLR